MIYFAIYALMSPKAVALRGFTSRYLTIDSGVPQGSHLGPLLFILYVNDIGSSLNSSRHLVYADDTKIFKIIKTNNDCLELQRDLDSFVAYCNSNQLLLNPDKCKCITFTHKREPLQFNYNFIGKRLTRVSLVRDLGIT